MVKRAYMVTLLIETNTCEDAKLIQDDVTIALVEDRALDTPDYAVTHVFDVQELPPMDNK